MITIKELETWIIGKLGLAIGQEIKGFELWNYLIQKGAFHDLESFLGLIPRYNLKESIISDDSITRSFFNQEIERLNEKQYAKLFRSYRISGIKIRGWNNPDGEARQSINVYGQYQISNGTKWSVAEWVLFSMNLK